MNSYYMEVKVLIRLSLKVVIYYLVYHTKADKLFADKNVVLMCKKSV